MISAMIGALAALAASAPPPPFPPGWEERAFEDVDGPDVRKIAAYLNEACAPRDLSGVQIFAIQSGHDQRFNLHLYCRRDAVPGVRYSVELRRFPKAGFNAALASLLADGRVRVGPFYFGAGGGPDGLLILRQER